MKTVLWVCAFLALAGALDKAAGIRNLLDTPQAQQSPSNSAVSTTLDLAQITNPKPAILSYPNAPGYPPDQAPDPAFMDLPDYAPGPGSVMCYVALGSSEQTDRSGQGYAWVVCKCCICPEMKELHLLLHLCMYSSRSNLPQRE